MRFGWPPPLCLSAWETPRTDILGESNPSSHALWAPSSTSWLQICKQTLQLNCYRSLGTDANSLQHKLALPGPPPPTHPSLGFSLWECWGCNTQVNLAKKGLKAKRFLQWQVQSIRRTKQVTSLQEDFCHLAQTCHQTGAPLARGCLPASGAVNPIWSKITN